jgi:peroxiredoxin
MKSLFFVLIFSAIISLSSECQVITEENYWKADKSIWENYENESSKILSLMRKYSDKKDSLNVILKNLLDLANQQNIDTAIKYASVPGGLQRLYMVRLDLPKDTLRSIMQSLPQSIKETEYGESIMAHLNANQINEGIKYYDFDAIDSDGNEFKLSSLKVKNILLLYNGLDCMGNSDLEVLKQLYNNTKRENLEIVVYWSSKNLEELKSLKSKFSVEYKLVSDFKLDHSPFKIIYGAQAKPTCFLIDQSGTVILKSVGLPEEKLIELLKEKKFN